MELIVLAVGSRVSLFSFLEEQEKQKAATNSNTKNVICDCSCLGQQLDCLILVVTTIVGGLVLQFVKSWSIIFGLTAICSLVALFVFLSGLFWHPYIRKGPQGSPLTTIIRVYVAAIRKMSEKLPEDHNNVNNLYMTDDHVQPTRFFRFFNKAAIILPTPSAEEQKKHKWQLCSVREVEDTKACLQMHPLLMNFILCGLVFSLENTYFLEQANHINQHLGRLKVTIFIFYLFSYSAGFISKLIYSTFKCCLSEKYRKNFPLFGIGFALIVSILCCITAAKIENRRLNVIRSIPDLLKDNPPKNIKIPMTMFWLVPQFMLLGVFKKISTTCFEELCKTGYPSSMNKYLQYFTSGLTGTGTALGYFFVKYVGEVSERGGTRPNWFQHTINQSHLDRYYWSMAVLSAVNLLLYILGQILRIRRMGK